MILNIVVIIIITTVLINTDTPYDFQQMAIPTI